MSRYYGDLADLAALGYGDWLDDLKGLIPGNTIVGKAIRGDVSGAAAGAIKLVNGGTAKPTNVAIQPTQSPGMFGGMPSWALPVAIGGVAIIALMMLRPRRR